MSYYLNFKHKNMSYNSYNKFKFHILVWAISSSLLNILWYLLACFISILHIKYGDFAGGKWNKLREREHFVIVCLNSLWRGEEGERKLVIGCSGLDVTQQLFVLVVDLIRKGYQTGYFSILGHISFISILLDYTLYLVPSLTKPKFSAIQK